MQPHTDAKLVLGDHQASHIQTIAWIRARSISSAARNQGQVRNVAVALDPEQCDVALCGDHLFSGVGVDPPREKIRKKSVLLQTMGVAVTAFDIHV